MSGTASNTSGHLDTGALPGGDELSDGKVVVVGGCTVDIEGVATLRHADSAPGEIHYSAGGVGRNIAENLARLDVNVWFISAVGEDVFGEYVLRHTAESGVNVSGVMIVPDRATGCYLSLLNATREMVHAVSNMDVIHTLSNGLHRMAPILFDARVVVVDCNLSMETIRAVADLCPPHALLLAEPVSVAKAVRLLPILHQIDIITPNELEAEALCAAYLHETVGQKGGTERPSAERLSAERLSAERLSELLQQSGIGDTIITFGARGVYRRSGSDHGWHPAIPPRSPRSTTGAGDAFAAGVVYGYVHGYRDRDIIAAGCATATLAVDSPQAVSRSMNRAAVDMLRRAY